MVVLIKDCHRIVDRYMLRARTLERNITVLHRRAIRTLASQVMALSQGDVSLTEQWRYFKENEFGMYGRGESRLPDYIINKQTFVTRDRRSGSWLQSFYQRISAKHDPPRHYSYLLNTAMSTTYSGQHIPLARAFRYGWRSRRKGPVMRPRPVAEKAIELARNKCRKLYNECLENAINLKGMSNS